MKPKNFQNILKGTVLATTTPYKEDLSIDFDELGELIDFYCNHKIGPLVINGSTSECSSNSIDEREMILQTVIKANKNRLPIIAGCSDSSTGQVIKSIKYAKKIGASGAMVHPPYYTFPGLEGLYRHYKIISEETDLGILLYLDSSILRTDQDFINNPLLLEKIIDIPNIVGLKDSVFNHWFHMYACADYRDKIAVLCGGGTCMYMFGRDYGARGYFAGLGNIWPEIDLKFMNALEKEDRDKATKIAYDYDMPYIRYFLNQSGGHDYISGIKALLDMEGLPGGGPVRPPLSDWPKDSLNSLKKEMVKIGLRSNSNY